jgi:L-amino acid N-acyltransferase YncA
MIKKVINFQDKYSKELLKIFNSGRRSKQFYRTDLVSWRDHKKWLALSSRNSSMFIFLLLYENKVVGYSRFDSIEENSSFEVSIAILKKYRNLGLGNFLLKNSIKKMLILKKIKKISAVTKKDNIKSWMVFLRNNFKIIFLNNKIKIKTKNAFNPRIEFYLELKV